MSATRRLFIGIAAPLVVVVGIGGMWVGKEARALKTQIESWMDSLEHSPDPVTMHVALLPLYVDGSRVGKVRTVVVQRTEPGEVDSLLLEVEVGPRGLGDLAPCHFQLDPGAFDRSGPFGIKHALRCLTEAGDLVPFGTIRFTDVGHRAPLYLSSGDLPCSRLGSGTAMEGEGGACVDLGHEVHRMRDEIRREIVSELEAAKIEIRRVGVEIDGARVQINR